MTTNKPRAKQTRAVAVHTVRRFTHRSPRLTVTMEREEWIFEIHEDDGEELAPLLPQLAGARVPKLLR